MICLLDKEDDLSADEFVPSGEKSTQTKKFVSFEHRIDVVSWGDELISAKEMSSAEENIWKTSLGLFVKLKENATKPE